MLWRWRSTVRTLRCSAAAISALPGPGRQGQDLELARGQRVGRARRRPRVRSGAEEGLDLADEDRPGGSSPSTMWLSLSKATSRAPGYGRRGSGRTRTWSSGPRGSAAPAWARRGRRAGGRCPPGALLSGGTRCRPRSRRAGGRRASPSAPRWRRDHQVGEHAAEHRSSRPADPDHLVEHVVRASLLRRRDRAEGRGAAVEHQPGHRSGCRTAYSIAGGPPCDIAISAKRSSPASSATASRSPIRASSQWSSTSQSERPWPRSS